LSQLEFPLERRYEDLVVQTGDPLFGGRRTMTRLLEFPPLAKPRSFPQQHASCPTYDF